MSNNFILQESFADFYRKEKALQELREWYAYDLKCIDKIINEGKIGDFISGAVSKVKNFAADKLQQAFAKLIQSIVGKDKKKAQEVAAGLQNIQNNPQALRDAAAQGNELLQGTQQINASYQQDNIRFLINSVFTESNLNELFATGILTEARTAKKINTKQPAKQSRALGPLVKQLTDILNKYKNPQTRKNTLDNFINKVNKKLTPQQAQGKQPQQSQQSQPQQSQSQQSQAQQPQSQQPQAQQGLFQKAMAWVKANPNMTAGAIIGLVSAIALATGGTSVLIPLIYKGLTGGAIGAGVNAIGQKVAGGKVDWKKAGAAGLKGAAAGMALGGLAKAASGIVHAFEGGGGGASYDDRHLKYQTEIAREAGLTKGQQFELRQGIPFDKNGNQLVDNETVKKIADKYHITTRLHGHVMTAAEKEAYDKSPTGFPEFDRLRARGKL